MKPRNALAAMAAVAAAVMAIAATPTAAATPLVAVRPAAAQPGVRPIPGAYLVQLKPGTDARSLARALSVRPRHTYDSAVIGFAADLTSTQLAALRRNPHVTSVEQDAVLENMLNIDFVTQYNPPSWGIDRIDERNLPLSASYRYPTGGGVVHAYVIDSGIDVNHPDFGGRATFDYNAIDSNNTDCFGHGTAVAGTIGSASYGVAKNVRLHAVKMFNCYGESRISAVAAAVDWVKGHAIHPAVANTSWSSGHSLMLETAIYQLMNSGVFLAAAAGNTGDSLCHLLPQGVAETVVVAATDSTDTRWNSSSIGWCVDIYAPGVSIRTTTPGGGNAVYNGTSLATAHVTGDAALIKSVAGDMSQAMVTTYLVVEATNGVIKGNLYGTPNRLLWNSYGGCNC